MSDPQALHDQLLAKIDEPIAGDNYFGKANEYRDALRAALELHKPEQHYVIGQDNRRTPSYQMCSACHCMANKCRTVKVIGAALGVTTDG